MSPNKSANECIDNIKSNNNIFIHSGVSAPQQLIKALVAKNSDLIGVNIYQMHTEGNSSYARNEYKKSFTVNNFFNGANMRADCSELSLNYIPIFLSEIPALFYKRVIDLDVALIQLSPPDKNGMCSLGPSVDITISAVRTAKLIIAQINPQMPRTFGDSQIHISKVHAYTVVDEPIHEVIQKPLTPEEVAIGNNIAAYIDDGSTLQLGIGSIPNAVLKSLSSHKDLGIHSEMFSDGVVDLYKKGVITGKYKKKHPYKIVSSFVIGSKMLYDFINDNTEVLLLDCGYTNNTHVIAQNPKVVAINGAVEVDLTGQVCADSIGSKIYSGVGGQMDFIRGASLSQGGKPIIALPSVTSKGMSKIVSQLKLGSGVVTTRAHVHYIATEYGVADLYGKSIRERIKEMIRIAHPSARETLSKEAYEIFKINLS
jgi:4-hydroxybutyrate CoA-transferase